MSPLLLRSNPRVDKILETQATSVIIQSSKTRLETILQSTSGNSGTNRQEAITALQSLLMQSNYKANGNKPVKDSFERLRKMGLGNVITEFAIQGVGLGRETSATGVLESMADYAIEDENIRYEIFRIGATLAPKIALQRLKTTNLTPEHRLKICHIAAQHAKTLDSKAFLEQEVRLIREGKDKDLETKKSTHIKSIEKEHILSFIESDELLLEVVDFFSVLIDIFLHDPLGTLFYLISTKNKSLDRILSFTHEQKIDLLRCLASHGLSLAFRDIEYFGIEITEENRTIFNEIFLQDAMAGFDIYGALTLQYAHKLRPDLNPLQEFELPRKLDAKTIASAKKAELARKPEVKKSPSDLILEAALPKTTTSPSIVESKIKSKELQAEIVNIFLGNISKDMALNWKDGFSETARNVVLSDGDLIVRQIVFLLVHGVIGGSEQIEKIFYTMEEKYQFRPSEKVQVSTLGTRMRLKGLPISDDLEEKLATYTASNPDYITVLQGAPDEMCEEMFFPDAHVEAIVDKYKYDASREKTPQTILKYANWNYFCKCIGFNSAILFDDAMMPTKQAAIEYLTEDAVHYLMRPLMSVYIRSGSAIFQRTKFWWRNIINISQETPEKTVDAAIQKYAVMLRTIDAILTMLSKYHGNDMEQISSLVINHIRLNNQNLTLDFDNHTLVSELKSDEQAFFLVKSLAELDVMIETTKALGSHICSQIAKHEKMSLAQYIQSLPLPIETLDSLMPKPKS